jgi:hypothetical protein
MNERIRELALLCYEECGDYHIGSNSQFNHQKFAELIVKECAELADEPTSRPFESYGEKIKKHFGVE